MSPIVALDDDLPAAYATGSSVAGSGGGDDAGVKASCNNCDDDEDPDEREAYRLKAEILTLLIDAGGDINVADTRRSPLLAAARKGDERLLEWFRSRGGKLDIRFTNDYHDGVMGNVSRGLSHSEFELPLDRCYLLIT